MIYIYRALVIVFWICGIVIAKGFWSTFFAIFFFPYAWYLVADVILRHFGVV